MNKLAKTLPLALTVCLSACLVGPDFEKPKYGLADGWKSAADAQFLNDNKLRLEQKDLAQWWKLFGDDDLVWLIDQAVKENFSLEIARARVEQAAAMLAVKKSGLWPSLDANASFREKAHPVNAKAAESYGIGATAAWEIDVFGGVRRSIESADADYRAALADSVAVKVKVAAEVAQAYFRYRAAQLELRITRDNLKTQTKTYQITKQRKANGFVSQLDVVRASAEVASTNAQIPQIEANEKLALHALELLAGLPAGSLRQRLNAEKPLPKLESFAPSGVPAELLERRPDIIVAEHKIHAATAAIGEARAEYYPKFSITGTISYDAPKIGSVVSNHYGSWSVGPTATWNIFQAGKTMASVKLKEAVAKEAKISWQSTVFTAVKEVEDALVSAGKERERIGLINALVVDNQKAFELSQKLYSAGEIEFLDLLVSQRALLASQQSQVNSRMQFVNHIVALYKALGGGWNPETESSGVQPVSQKSAKN